MEGNDLVTEDVVAIGDVAGDGDSAAVVVGNEVVSGPGTRLSGVADQTTLVDLEEFQGSLVNIGTVAITVGHVGDDGTVVA